jgi:hypothetical protein
MASQDQQALNQIRKLLPLDDESLTQLLEYSRSLSPNDAADHLKSVLGDSPQALEFISNFNSKRNHVTNASASAPGTRNNSDAGDGKYSSVPKVVPKKKKGAGLRKLPPVRQVQGSIEGAYVKKELEEYMPQQRKHRDGMASAFALDSESSSLEPSPANISREPSPRPAEQLKGGNKLPPSAAGRLISDTKSKSQSGKPKVTKVSIAGGMPMHGASTALSDLENAIRELEIQTNPTLAPTAEQNAKRKCNCMATRHELLTAAPNCMNCGKIICVKEGLGPCTFCNKPILSSVEIDSMLRVLKDERGKEKMNANNASYRRADVAASPRPFTAPTPAEDNGVEKLSQAMQHRDRLLAFQAQNAKRTRIHDEAADFETPSSGLNAWASPAERALQLKKQQKALREQEWNSRPEWEKKKVVASIDLVGGKVVRRMATVERPKTPESDTGDDYVPQSAAVASGEAGAFGRNPLLGKLIKPTARVDVKGKGKAEQKQNTWRRVQDSQEDNEEWILNGSSRGQIASDEPACG